MNNQTHKNWCEQFVYVYKYLLSKDIWFHVSYPFYWIVITPRSLLKSYSNHQLHIFYCVFCHSCPPSREDWCELILNLPSVNNQTHKNWCEQFVYVYKYLLSKDIWFHVSLLVSLLLNCHYSSVITQIINYIIFYCVFCHFCPPMRGDSWRIDSKSTKCEQIKATKIDVSSLFMFICNPKMIIWLHLHSIGVPL